MPQFRLITDNDIVITKNEYHRLVQDSAILQELKETKTVLQILELTETFNDNLVDGEEVMTITEMGVTIEERIDIIYH